MLILTQRYFFLLLCFVSILSCTKTRKTSLELLEKHSEILEYTENDNYITIPATLLSDSGRLYIFNYKVNEWGDTLPDGPQFSYYLNEKIATQGFLKREKLVGEKYNFNTNGSLLKFRMYDTLGNLYYIRHYLNDNVLAYKEEGKYDFFYYSLKPVYYVGDTARIDYFVPTPPDIQANIKAIVKETGDSIQFKRKKRAYYFTEYKCKEKGVYHFILNISVNDLAFNRKEQFVDTIICKVGDN